MGSIGAGVGSTGAGGCGVGCMGAGVGSTGVGGCGVGSIGFFSSLIVQFINILFLFLGGNFGDGGLGGNTLTGGSGFGG